jgi:DHA3 family macrolide efflux protein-like MFS transporter
MSSLATLAAGPLADKVLEPAMSAGGKLVPIFGGLVGTGPGAGMALLFVLAGIGGTLAGLGGYFVRRIRDAESILPDYDAAVGGSPAAEQPA